MKTLAIKYFPKGFFWEFDTEKIFMEDSKKLIIERVLNRTSRNKICDAIPILEKFYSKEDIIDIAIKSPQIFGNETIEVIANYFNIEPKLFYRYHRHLI